MSKNTIVIDASNETAAALVSTIRYATNGASKYIDYAVANNVTKDNVKDHAVALAVFAYPNLPTKQAERIDGKAVRTKFGNAVQAAGNGLRKALKDLNGPAPKADKPTNLLTKDGVDTFADMSDTMILILIRAELERRAK